MMSGHPKDAAEVSPLVLFDVDGVLVDSLAPHLAYSCQKAKEFGLTVDIPSVKTFQRLVRSGVVVSPMKEFLLAVGFPERLAEIADRDYSREFMRQYEQHLYPGAPELLRSLKVSGARLGIVTSNVLPNVQLALSEVWGQFDPKLVFTKDSLERFTKSWAIQEAMRRTATPSQYVTYVGDQPADYLASKAAGVRFIGVSWGWGIAAEDAGQFDVAETFATLSTFLAATPAERLRHYI